MVCLGLEFLDSLNFGIVGIVRILLELLDFFGTFGFWEYLDFLVAEPWSCQKRAGGSALICVTTHIYICMYTCIYICLYRCMYIHRAIHRYIRMKTEYTVVHIETPRLHGHVLAGLLCIRIKQLLCHYCTVLRW